MTCALQVQNLTHLGHLLFFSDGMGERKSLQVIVLSVQGRKRQSQKLGCNMEATADPWSRILFVSLFHCVECHISFANLFGTAGQLTRVLFDWKERNCCAPCGGWVQSKKLKGGIKVLESSPGDEDWLTAVKFSV